MGKKTRGLIELDFKGVVLTGVDGEPLQVEGADEFHKNIADIIHRNTTSLEMLVTAQEIFKTGVAQMKEAQARQVLTIFQSDRCGMAAFARKPVIDYIQSRLGAD